MRPEQLFPIFAPTSALPGVGPRIAKALAKAAGPHIVDLLWHVPRDIIDRRAEPSVRDAMAGRIATLALRVLHHTPPPNRRRPWRVACCDDSGEMDLLFFHGDGAWLSRTLPERQTRLVSGRVEDYGGRKQMLHPDYIVPPERKADIPRIEPVYGLSAGLSGKAIRKAVHGALARLPELPEWLDPAHLKRECWPAWAAALRAVHEPAGPECLSDEAPARRRLAYDELLANQLALALIRARARRQPGVASDGDGHLRNPMLAALPYDLTPCQKQAWQEIRADMAEPARMLRLLQGDVGSGKTVVSVLAMLNALECGGQAAMMAPTEILARQHYRAIADLLRDCGLLADEETGTEKERVGDGPPAHDANHDEMPEGGVRLAFLSGRDGAKARAATLKGLASGRIAMVVGTHALFQDAVVFHDLRLAVVDEQHRFGVHQRLSLAGKGKGKAVDMLVVTATPIPRTLMMSAYGDLDMSRLMQKPPGRKPVRTSVVPETRLEEVIAAVRRKQAEGAGIFWVCPLVEESELTDLAAAEARHAELSARFGADAVALAHGRMKSAEKDAAMTRFATGEAAILVATTVIEVGVDVPRATLMVIEHAERFGLAQLHQLRGRVGRGSARSDCILVRAQNPGEAARSRLRVMSETEDGFLIAEKDLELRGAGEILGVRQSGMPDFRLADPARDRDLMQTAHADARLILERDPGLDSPRGRNLRLLLYLFERDAVVVNLSSG